jgi:diguanylate cyclase (GGDEF)-like protein
MIAVIAIVSIVIFGVLNITIENKLNELKIHERDFYSEITRARADELSKELQGHLNKVHMVAHSDFMESMDVEAILPFLSSLLNHSDFKGMTLAQPDGKAWTTYGTTIDIREQEQFTKIFERNKLYAISDPFYSPYFYDDVPIITLSYAIQRGNTTVGLLNAVLTTRFMETIISDIRFDTYGYAWIVDGNGGIVAHPDPNIDIIHDYTAIIKEIDTQPFTSGSGSFNYIGYNDEKMLAVYSTIHNTNAWKLVISVQESQAFDQLISVMNFIDWAIIISLLSLISFAFIYANTLTKPIVKLTEVFGRAEKGDLSVVADTSVKNELGVAAQSFNRMLNEIKNLTFVDPVTQVPNYRSYLLDAYRLTREHPDKQFYVVVLSVDDFKKINSMGGYGFGNETLKQFAELLNSSLYAYELVARYFGDEMVLFLHAESEEIIRLRIQRLLALAQRPFKIMDIEIHLSLSCGFASHNKLHEIETTIHNATLAKLKAKKLGGNIAVFFEDGIQQEIKKEQDIEAELYQAIEKKELYPVYQPIVDLKTMKTSGFETLLRWNHPLYYQESIQTIITIAENNSQIIEIGRYILNEAILELKRLNQKYPDMVLALNVSALQLKDTHFITFLKNRIKVIGVKPENLCIELTESTAMDDVEVKLMDLHQIKAIGCKIAIDDFGTGYSSLAYLSRFPIDHIKIDKSFVHKMMNDEPTRQLVSSMITLAHNLNLEVVAEGVETQEQVSLLKAYGCDMIQGYFISKPKRMEEHEL